MLHNPGHLKGFFEVQEKECPRKILFPGAEILFYMSYFLLSLKVCKLLKKCVGYCDDTAVGLETTLGCDHLGELS